MFFLTSKCHTPCVRISKKRERQSSETTSNDKTYLLQQIRATYSANGAKNTVDWRICFKFMLNEQYL
jgi:hypothetical protein